MSRTGLIPAILAGFLAAATASAQPVENEPCNAQQLVLEARRFIEANRPARVALTRLLRALNDCPDENVAFDLNLYLAVALMHEGRVPEARQAAARAQANAWDDEQAARAGAVQIALRDLIGEVVFDLPSAHAGDIKITVAAPGSLPPDTALLEALPKEKAFAHATFDAMIGAAQTHVREAGLQLVTVYLPTGTYRLGNGQMFRVGTGTTNLEVKAVERWPRTIGIALGTYSSISPVDGTTLDTGHAGSMGAGLTYGQAVGRRLALFARLDCSPLEVLPVSPDGDGGNSEANAEASESATLSDLATELLRSGSIRAWNVSARVDVGWPVAIQPDTLWLVPRVGANLRWIEGVVISSDVTDQTGQASDAHDPDTPPSGGVVGEWAGGGLDLELSLHWRPPFPADRAFVLVLVLDGGLGTGWIRGTPGPTVPSIPPTLDLVNNALVTGGATLALTYRF